MKKNAFNKIGTLSITALVCFAQVSVSFADFKDVPASYSQADAINFLQAGNIIQGYSDQTFKPDQLVTRGEFLKMVFNDVGYKASPNLDKTAFNDVPSGSWLAPYVKKALDLNIITANGSNPMFNPGSPIKRADAIKIAFAVEGIPTPYYSNIDQSDLFDDVTPTSPFAYLARAAKQNGIASVKNPDAFWGNHLMTRGDAAELIYQVQLSREASNDNGSSDSDYSSGSASDSGTQEVDTTALDQSSLDLLSNPKFAILLDIWKKANNDFYYKQNVDKDTLIYGAIKGMVDNLGDQYSVFEDPTDAADLQQYLQGQFAGIGTVIQLVNNQIVIVKTLPGSPAEKANLQTGDIITQINGQDLSKLTSDQAIALIRGDVGTSVNLTIQRNGQTLPFTLTRATITTPDVTSKMINNIAYIDISQFTEDSGTDFATTLTSISKNSPTGYILDLRGNPGGYLDAAVQILGHFFPNGTMVVSTKDVNGTQEKILTNGAGELKGKPLVVLVDDGTASAAEITAGAIQDLNAGKLVGVKTFGKGSVQEITNYSDNSLLKLTIAHWQTPNGRDINGVGLTPDVNIELDQTQILQGTDNQLQKAISILTTGN